MKTKILLLLPLAALGLWVAGCQFARAPRPAQATSVMQFLYPKDREHVDFPGVPVLRLPLRVGIAFVPPAGRFSGNFPAAISEAAKEKLLQRVAAEFRGLPYVRSIEVIPTAYLRPEGGFENLDQLREMFQVDVIALVAYDQTQFTNEGVLSLAYWTIVGAYVVQGEKNDTQTLMEAAVYDIASRRLLFRAPGASQVKASATPINLSEQLQADSRQSFEAATTEMIANLKSALEDFKVRVNQSPGEFKIEHQPGYTGGGALGEWLALGLSGLALFAIARRIEIR